MTGSYALLTGAAVEPITLAEAKEHCRVETAADDAYISDLIGAARQLVCRHTGRALTTETWTLTLDAWPGARQDEWWDGMRDGAISIVQSDHVAIRKAPFLTVTSVKTVDEAGVETTWAASNYYATKDLGFGRLVKKRGGVWPTVDRDRGGILITFTAGYGTLASDVPLALRQAVKMLVLHWYEHREPGDAAATELPFGLSSILAQYRVLR